MLEVKNLSFSYGKNHVLQDISVRFEAGKLYCIVGPNGCGKTTLIKVLSRLNKPKSGELTIDNRKYETIPRVEFAKLLALLPQGRNIPNMSVFDLVACGRFPHLDLSRKLTKEDENILWEAMKATETESYAENSVKKLSGGQRQRVYIAMLLAQNTPYVLLDEPTTHLDISSKYEIMHLMNSMKAQDKCVIAVLHDLELALQYADEIILMDQGQVRSCDSPEKLFASGQLQEVFGVDCKLVEVDGQKMYCFNPSL